MEVTKHTSSLTTLEAIFNAEPSLPITETLGYTEPIVPHSLRALKTQHADPPGAIINFVTLSTLEVLHYASSVEDSRLLSFFIRSTPPLTFLGADEGPPRIRLKC